MMMAKLLGVKEIKKSFKNKKASGIRAVSSTGKWEGEGRGGGGWGRTDYL